MSLLQSVCVCWGVAQVKSFVLAFVYFNQRRIAIRKDGNEQSPLALIGQYDSCSSINNNLNDQL